MSIQNPRLVCADPDLDPGTVRVTWETDRGPREIHLAGNEADNLMEHYRAAPDAPARWHVLAALIEAGAAHV